MKNFDDVRKILERQKYAIVGGHSGVQVCRWTKNSLNKKGVCWKEKFYGIKSHRCCQMSPAVMWCENSCLHCWRPIEFNQGCELKEVDSPIEILDGIISARKNLLMGYKGIVSEKKFEEAIEPELFTFSLSGEPTLYPKLGEMIGEIRKRGKISFLVTNGLNPEVLRKLRKNLPTQLTISMNAPNKKLFNVWHRSKKKDAWKKFNESLDLLRGLKGRVRRVVRLTLVKKGDGGVSNMSEKNIKEYVELIKKAEPDFVHVKGFMSVGFARERMGYDKMPWHYEVKRFGESLVKELKGGWKVLDEEERSCVLVLGKNKRMMKIGRV